MDKIKKSPAQLLSEIEIKPVEKLSLDRVFEWLCSRTDDEKDEETKGFITIKDLNKALKHLGTNPL